ncbi:hypothetical protein JTB14_030945 [Gonioctena quinquepunctata]|nr:hypothetical protein JTB14_030945 [Gonioctena quinquepunctata]
MAKIRIFKLFRRVLTLAAATPYSTAQHSGLNAVPAVRDVHVFLSPVVSTPHFSRSTPVPRSTPGFPKYDAIHVIVYDLPSARNDILINLDERTRNAALRFYNWKLIVGASQNGSFNDYYGDIVTADIEEQLYNTTAVSESPAGTVIRKINYNPLAEEEYDSLRKGSTIKCLDSKSTKNPCEPSSGALCLYDIPSDPCEENDLAKFFPSVVRRMKRALVDYRAVLVTQIEEETDIENANPKLFHHTWNPWLDCTDSECLIKG